MHIQEQYTPVLLLESATTPITNSAIGGIFCTGGGTFTVNGYNDQGALVALVSFTGTANTWYRLPFFIGANGGNVVTGAGATGTLAA